MCVCVCVDADAGKTNGSEEKEDAVKMEEREWM